jgi:spore coat polysaccharide biosynthesis protein SpsF (cytidylyltransferase family)
VRLTVDEPKDLEVIKHIVNDLGLDKDWRTYAEYYLNNPKVKALNDTIVRNEGYQKSVDEDKNN